MASNVPTAAPPPNIGSISQDDKLEVVRASVNGTAAGDGSFQARLTGNPFFTAVSSSSIFQLSNTNIRVRDWV